MTTAVDFDPYSPDFVRDPYPTYRRLLVDSPIFYDSAWDLTFFASHRDVTGILRDRRFGRDIRHVLPLSEVDSRTYPTHLPAWYRMVRGSFIDLEPPEHTRIRSRVNRSFTRRRSELRRSAIEASVDHLVETLADRAVDLIAELAMPIPIITIAELMGIPPGDHDRLLEWSHAIVRVFDLNVTPDEEEVAERSTVEFVAYLRDILARRRSDPGDDLISDLLHSNDPLDEDDLVARCILVLNAGHEATVHAIGNGLLTLARHPGVHERMRSEPHLVPSAVEELLRFDPPLHMFERWVLEDVEWEGVELAQGSKVGLLFGAANHDPAVFDDPGTVDIARSFNTHVSFGLGIHHCVGAPLARLELEAVFRAVTRRFQRIDLDVEDPPRTPSLVFRGVRELPATLAG